MFGGSQNTPKTLVAGWDLIKMKNSNKRKRGRPSTNFDKRAYQREYMRRRRAKAKLLRQGDNICRHVNRDIP